MDATDAAVLVSVLVAGLVSALLALGIPFVVGRLPEPDPDPDLEGEGESEVDPARAADPPKERWVDLAALPGLGWRCAVAAGLVGAVVGWRLGPAWTLLPWLAMVPAGVALAVVDWRTRLLPLRLVWPTLGVVAVLVVVAGLGAGEPAVLARAAATSAVAFAVYYALWWMSPRSLGYGDVRLSAVLGLALGHLGVGEALVGLWSGFVIGGLSGLVLRWAGRLARRQHVPFGPFMLVGALVGLLWGGPLWASIYG